MTNLYPTDERAVLDRERGTVGAALGGDALWCVSESCARPRSELYDDIVVLYPPVSAGGRRVCSGGPWASHGQEARAVCACPVVLQQTPHQHHVGAGVPAALRRPRRQSQVHRRGRGRACRVAALRQLGCGVILLGLYVELE